MRAALVVAALTLVLPVALARAGGTRTIGVSGSVDAIAAEGGLVAAHVRPAHGCDQLLLWRPATGSVRRQQHCSSSDAVLQGLTLAGGVATWWDWSSGNHVYCDDLYADGRPLGVCDGTEGDTFYQLAGDRTLTAIADYTVCEADCTDANGDLLPDGDYGVEVRRLVGGKLVPLLAPRDFRVFLDARNWRVATIEPGATLTVYDARGQKRWSVAGVKGVFGGWIDDDSVVVHQTRSVRVYTAAGAGVARPLPGGAVVRGVVGGLVVYRTGSSVHVLRLSDGRDAAIVTVRGLHDLALTPAGVFYAAQGSLTFVPLAAALPKLR